MRELVYYVGVSLDGFIAAPDGNVDAFPVEGDHMTYLIEQFGDALPAHVLGALGVEPPRSRFDTIVMGWRTYTPALDVGITSPYSHLRQIVATRQPRDVPEEITLTDDPVATVRELKAGDGLDIYLAGGGELAGALYDEIDRLVVKRYPLALGDGISVFGRAPYRPRQFDLVSSLQFESGASVQEYVPVAAGHGRRDRNGA